jgi:hypothetical protein
MTTPLEARCDRCAHLRHVALFQPDHTIHPDLGALTCRRCTRPPQQQPLLCDHCTEVEHRLHTATARAAAAKSAQALADRAMCDGIEAATHRAETDQ